MSNTISLTILKRLADNVLDHQNTNSLGEGETSAVRSEHLKTVEHAIICDLIVCHGRKRPLNQKFYLSAVSTKRITGRTPKNASRNKLRQAGHLFLSGMGRPPSPTHLNHLPTATQAPQHRVSVPIPHPAAAGLIPEFLDPSRTWPPTGHPAGGRISGDNSGGRRNSDRDSEHK